MKKQLLMLLILSVFATSVSAQESIDQTISRLETEIGVREKIDSEPSTPTAQKLTNRANLDKARTALVNAVQTKIAALEKYINTLGPSMTPEEKVDARAALQTLSTTANRALNSGNGAGVPAESSIAAPASSSVQPPSGTAAVSPSENAPTSSPAVSSSTGANDSTAGSSNQTSAGATAAADDDDDEPAVKTPFTRAIFGLEQAAAASADPEQKLFLEFNLTAPITKKDKAINAPLWLWLNPRITSLPQQISGSVAEFATAENFVSPFTSANVNEIVQGFSFLGGIEVPIPGAMTSAIPSGFGEETKARFGLSFVLGAGMSTPFSTQKTIQVFKVNSTVTDAFPGAKGKDFIAFVSGDRNRFFREYYAGLRLKTYYVTKDDDEELRGIFPGVIDITFGQNESITGGDLHGGVVRIDGIYPLPFIKGKYAGAIYAFGSVFMKLSRPKITPPVILDPADETVQVPGDNVFIQQVPPRDTDHYRLGVGVDLIRLLKRN